LGPPSKKRKTAEDKEDLRWTSGGGLTEDRGQVKPTSRSAPSKGRSGGPGEETSSKRQESRTEPPPTPVTGNKKNKKKKPERIPVRKPVIVTREWLPSRLWQIKDDRLIFQPSDDVIFKCSTQLKLWSRTISFPVKPLCLVDSLSDPARLPTPAGKGNVSKEWVNFPGMMLLPRPVFDGCHAGRCDCVLHGQKHVHHRESVLADSCLRRGLLSQSDLAVTPNFKQPYVENPSHYYYWCEERRDHLLAVPQPFRNGGSWPPVYFSPAMSDCADRQATSLYYALYNAEKAKAMASIYMVPPAEWSKETHPCLGEPLEGSELWRLSHQMYGVESVPRCNYTHHPLAEKFFYLYLAADATTLQVPVLHRNPERPDLPNAAIGRVLEPFWKYGMGRVLCSVCLAAVINGDYQPVFLARTEFVRHWIGHHLSSLVAVATFSATGLNSRIYQGHSLYILALNADQQIKDMPEACPVNLSTRIEGARWTVSRVLCNILRPVQSVATPLSSDAPMPGQPKLDLSSTPPVARPGLSTASACLLDKYVEGRDTEGGKEVVEIKVKMELP